MISIRHQLTRNLLITFLVLLVGGLGAIFYVARDELIEQFNAALRAKASAVSSMTESEGDWRSHLEFSTMLQRDFTGAKAHDYFELWRVNGDVIARSASLQTADLPRKTGNENHPKIWNLQLPDGQPGRAIGITYVRHSDEKSAQAVPVELVVASDRSDLDEALGELLGSSILCGALFLAATFWVVPRVLRRGLMPLGQLGEQVSRMDAGSLAVRFPSSDLPAELGPICARLNDLFARLDQSFERERRFSADLAHELRTPVAELRSLAECALKWPDSRDAATDSDVLAIAQQMEGIVTNLLALTRGERAQMASRLEPVDAATIVRDAWRGFALRASEQKLKVEFSLEPATASADAVLLRSILNNLFDNAVSHATPGGVLRAGVSSAGGRVSLYVANTANDLETADVEKLFDRFWRKEAARSGGHHVGLGLTLARAFATAMGWTLAAMLDESHQLVFTLSGPAAKPAAAALEMPVSAISAS